MGIGGKRKFVVSLQQRRGIENCLCVGMYVLNKMTFVVQGPALNQEPTLGHLSELVVCFDGQLDIVEDFSEEAFADVFVVHRDDGCSVVRVTKKDM